MSNRRYLPVLETSGAGALLGARPLVTLLRQDPRPRIVVDDPHRALITLVDLFRPAVPVEAEVHPTAVLGRHVRLGEKVRIGPYAVIEEGVRIGDGTSVGAHVVLGTGARIGRNTILHPHVVLYPGTVVGSGVILHSGVRVGVDGFGYVAVDGGVRKVPQIGGCVIEDDVEIGANATVDRGSIGETRLGAGSKLDNLVHIGHNVTLGKMALFTAQVGVAGSTHVGAGVQAGGQSGIAGHITVGDGAQIAAQAGVIGDVDPGTTVMGFPARPRAEFLRGTAAQLRLPQLISRVRRLESRLEDLAAVGLKTEEDPT
jgi:UDP-3-O-[3-hydroxymyristoyl] glucosamine N-acyltransferase